MRREDIANFLTAERSISPLTAFSLLIVAGFIAGSLQLVAPQSQVIAVNQDQAQYMASNLPAVDPVVMTAAVAGGGDEPVTSTFQDESGKEFKPEDAPENCTKAIQAALGKQEGPKVVQTDKGQSGKMDFCFGAVLKPTAPNGPSQDPKDYQCVGRSGTVTIDAKEQTAKTDTKPDKNVPMGQCKVKVCQTYQLPAPYQNSYTAPKCSDPKQYGAGQGGNAQSAGLPPLPQMPQPPQGSPPPSSPQPEQPKPDLSRGLGTPATANPPETKPAEDEPFKLDEVKPDERTLTALCANGQPCDGTAKIGPTGAVVPAADGETFVAPDPNDPSLLDPTRMQDRPQEGMRQTTTFDEPDPAARVQQPEDEKGLLARAGDYAREKWQGAKDTVKGWLGYPTGSEDCGENCTSIPKNTGPSNQELGNPCASDPSNCTTIAKTTPGTGAPPPTQQPPAQQPPAQQPPAQQPPPQQPPPQQPPTTIPEVQSGPRQTTGGGLGSLGGSSGLMSFLGGLMKGLGVGSGASAPQQQGTPQTCPTDQQAYAQYQQQYNYQLQQYNYQLEQYNYQVRNNTAYGYTNSIVPPVAPQPCRPGYGGPGTNQCPQLPPQPSPTTCPTGTWRQMTASGGGIVCPVWQCVPNSATTPTAQISCNPDVAEKGSRITVSYTCTNAQRSTGFGFETNGATAGAQTIVVDPPADAIGANYAIRCEDGQLTAGAQCTVQLAKVSISLRAEPNPVTVGESGLIGWVTTGMKSCTISSTDQADFTARNAGRTATTGIATTSPMTETADFYLDCVTVTGESRQEKITVDAYRPGTVSTSIENRTDVVRGSSAMIRWSFPDAPDLSAVALWLYSVEEEKTVALITGHRAKTGTYTWDLPTEDEECNMSSSIVCGSDLILGSTYAVFASLYQPVNANLGEFGDSSLPAPKFLDNPISGAFKVVQ